MRFGTILLDYLKCAPFFDLVEIDETYIGGKEGKRTPAVNEWPEQILYTPENVAWAVLTIPPQRIYETLLSTINIQSDLI